jgi:hypothetical protein
MGKPMNKAQRKAAENNFRIFRARGAIAFFVTLQYVPRTNTRVTDLAYELEQKTRALVQLLKEQKDGT